jgi:hypothetical protein
MAAAQVARSFQNVPSNRSSISLASSGTSRGSFSLGPPKSNTISQSKTGQQPVAVGNGVTCFIFLHEPHVYLNGSDSSSSRREDDNGNGAAMIRGTLVLDVAKSAKIKAVTLSFCGKARTEWPEGERGHSALINDLR